MLNQFDTDVLVPTGRHGGAGKRQDNQQKNGEELIAWVKLAPDAAPVTGDDLREFCKGKIAHYKIPKNYKFVDQFTITVTGKIQKFKMREISIEEMGLTK